MNLNIPNRISLRRMRALGRPLFFLAVISAVSRAAAGDTPAALSKAEEYIATTIATGGVANLETKFANEADRIVGAAFLEDLLTSTNRPVHRRGVRITGAIVTNSLDLVLADVAHDAQLEKCRFTAPVDMSQSRFQRRLSFEHSMFKINVNCGLMRVDGEANFEGAIFEGAADFTWADIKGGLLFDCARFTNHEARVSFNSASVGHNASFTNATFSGETDFVGMKIAGQFNATDIRFENINAVANFNGMKSGGIAYFDGAVFAGGVDFRTAKITGEFHATDTHFINTNKVADFGGVQIGESAYFDRAVFAGGVNFGDAKITGWFGAAGAHFENTNGMVNFSGVKIGSLTIFTNAVFAGEVAFTSATITDQFNARGAQFMNTNKPVEFGLMNVSGAAFFERAVFQGPVNFWGAHFWSSLNLIGARFSNAVNRTNSFNADFTGLKVDGAAYFNKAEFGGTVSLRDAKFTTVDLSIADRPSVPNSFALDGMTYERIVAGTEGITWDNLKGLLKDADYRPDVYVGLEAFFRRQGDTKQADQVFYEQNDRERQKAWADSWILGGLKFIGSYVLAGTVRYGRHPSLALIWMGVVIAIGYSVFRGRNADGTPIKMEQQNPDDAPRVWNAFWYSVDLFAPVIDLQSANFWKPKLDSGWVRHYARWHRILGWILVPIVLAALTGIIK